MQQRQLRLGDILDDYCPRERRVTNHAVVAMVGDTVKQTRCTTCDADHEYKYAKVPRQRKKAETPAALYAQVAAGAPKKVAADPVAGTASNIEVAGEAAAAPEDNGHGVLGDDLSLNEQEAPAADQEPRDQEEGPVHRPLIRASLPRLDGQPPPTRPMPEFTIRQPGAG